MNSKPNLDLSLFTETPDKDVLDILYSLNQENTPEVGNLESIDELSKLIDLSAINFLVLKDEEIVGFIICFREKSGYRSLNYRFFNKSENIFSVGPDDLAASLRTINSTT